MRTKLLALTKIALAFILLSAMFFAGIAMSASNYDPWYDLDDDGDIDIFDIVKMAGNYGTTGTPINKTALLLELQSRVGTIEQKLGQSRWIRFFEPNETMTNDQASWKDAATFTWNPFNSTNNAILSMVFYYQYRCESQGVLCRLVVNGEPSNDFGVRVSSEYSQEPIRQIDYHYDVLRILPNRNNYTIKFQTMVSNSAYAGYVRNINILIEVADGL